jgi:TonB-dependent receptor
LKGLSVWLVSKQTHKQTYKQTHIGTTIKMKQKNKIYIAVLAALTSFGSARADETQDSHMEVMQVSGIYKSMSKSLSEKRYADSIVDTINADDIGKFPDENLAESLQRITGVSISRQDGEGQQVSIRGLGPSFNKVTLNGRTATSGTGSRSFSFDLLASELVSSLEVVKSPTADLDEGGLGGTINVNTAKPLDYDEFKFVASAKGVYNDLSDDWGPQASALISNTFADNTLGFLGSVAFSDRNLRNDGYAQNGYVNLLPDIGDYINNSDSIYPLNTVPDLTLQNRKKMNFYGVVQWQPSDSFELVFDVLKADFDK